MLPITATQRLGHPRKIGFLLFLLSRSAPLLKHLPRILNQSKKRQSPARFGRYLGLIEAQYAGVPAFVAAEPSSLAGIFQFVKIFITIDLCADFYEDAQPFIGAPPSAKPVGAF